MSRIVHGVSATIRGTRPAATAANFPACKHFFTCDQGAGTYELKDVVGGVRLQSHEWEEATSSSIKSTYISDSGPPYGSHNRPLAAGSWNLDSQKKILAVTMMRQGATLPGSIGIGDSPSEEEFIMGGSQFYLLSVATIAGSADPLNKDTVFGGAGMGIGNAVPAMVGGYWAPNATLTAFKTDIDGNYVAAAPVSTAVHSRHPAFTPTYSVSSPQSIQEWYGTVIFQFETSYPPNIPEAIEWMRREWLAGNKDLPPMWAGII